MNRSHIFVLSAITLLLSSSLISNVAFAEHTGDNENDGFQVIDYENPVPGNTGEIVARGTAGDHISWLFQNHVLTITGYGEMSTDTEFSFLGSSVFQVVFEGDILTISDRCFYHCTSLQTAELPNTLKSIGDSAFFYTNIAELVLPYGCETIGNGVFSFSTLQRISIPDTVSQIGNEAFGFMPEPEEPLPYAYSSVHATIVCNSDSYAAQYAKDHSLVILEYGDANCDGVTDQYDVFMIRDFLTSGKSASLSMDLNSDMTINAIDLTLLKRRILNYAF